MLTAFLIIYIYNYFFCKNDEAAYLRAHHLTWRGSVLRKGKKMQWAAAPPITSGGTGPVVEKCRWGIGFYGRTREYHTLAPKRVKHNSLLAMCFGNQRMPLRTDIFADVPICIDERHLEMCRCCATLSLLS